MDNFGYSHAVGTYKTERGREYYYYVCDRCGKEAGGYRLASFRGHAYCEECKKLNQKEYLMKKRKSEMEIVCDMVLAYITNTDKTDGTEKVFSGNELKEIVKLAFEEAAKKQ